MIQQLHLVVTKAIDIKETTYLHQSVLPHPLFSGEMIKLCTAQCTHSNKLHINED